MQRDSVLTAARWLLRILRVANALAALLFAGLLVFSVIGHDFLSGVLSRKYGGAFDVGSAILAMQMMLVLGLAVVPPAHIILTALLRMLASVETGDPFIAPNARRLQSIGWGLLAIQIADLLYGVATFWFERIGLESSGWNPSIAGWISVLMAFVLARVFTLGTRMRDELEMTV